jgi:hypothetical protein
MVKLRMRTCAALRCFVVRTLARERNLRMRTVGLRRHSGLCLPSVRHPRRNVMAPIAWARPGPRPSALPFLSIPPKRNVILLAPPSSFVCLHLHYLDPGSAPCRTSACPHCAQGNPNELYAYAPAVFFDAGRRAWTRCILPIGNPWGDLSARDYRAFQLVLDKKKKRDGTAGGLAVLDAKELAPEVLAAYACDTFDIRPRLMQRWGIDPAVEKPLPLFDQQPTADQGDTDELPAVLPFTGRKGGAA